MRNPLLIAMNRIDSWVNLATGIGSGRGRTNFQFQDDPRLSDDQLEALYHSDPFAARVCSIWPEEATRQGVRIITGDAEQESAISTTHEVLQTLHRLKEAWLWGNVFGGAAVLLGIDDGRDPAQPVDETSIAAVRFLAVVDKRELIPVDWNDDPLTASFGQPALYRMSRQGGVSVDYREIHASRLLRFDGVITNRRRRRRQNGWSDSDLQRVYDALQQFNGAWASVSTILQDATQGVFKVKDLFTLLAGDSSDAVRKRLELMDLARSVAKSVLVDADSESFERVDTSLTGLPDTIEKFMLRLAGAAEMPVTILFGQAPAGMNATGDSDIRAFYDRVKSKQQNVLAPKLRRLTRFVLLSSEGPTRGVEPDSWHVEFAPLWQPTDQERANERKTIAETDAIYLTAGVLTPEEVALSRFRPAGWNAETEIDLDVRTQVQAADVQPEGAVPGPGAAEQAQDTSLHSAPVQSQAQTPVAPPQDAFREPTGPLPAKATRPIPDSPVGGT